ncbi:MAG TPA: transporter [Holophagaceae bacterium]|nr:transporter [Holophagaceae bacterium]
MHLNRLLLPLLACLPLVAQEKAKEPEGISDNSFLIEEAYNQEKGVVQHISTWQRFHGVGNWMATFTQEWPMGSQTHQFSFTAPYLHIPGTPNGLGDVALNYRYQVVGGDPKELSFSPRLSLLLPTGDEKKGRGTGALGLQLNLPLSVPVSDHLVTHWNAGATHIPKAKNELGNKADLAGINVGASVIWNLHPEFDLMLEWVHTAQDVVAGPGLKVREKATYLNPGLRWAHNFDSGLQIVPGIAYTYGVGSSRGDNAIFLYLSFEHPFGKR